jgi:hypothetical protein
MKMPRSLQKSSFTPRLESLEERLTPTLAVTAFGPNLSIAAVTAAQVNSNHVVRITDDGRGDIIVTADGSTSVFHDITSITVTGGNKADFVGYILTGDLTGKESLFVNLKQGDDHFTGLLLGKILGAGGTNPAPSNLNIRVDNGPGNDTARLFVLGDVQSGATLGFTNTSGGNSGTTADLDTAVVEIDGKIAGRANFDFTSGKNPNIANRPSVTFLQTNDISGTETVTMHGTTAAGSSPLPRPRPRRLAGVITDIFRYTGQLTGTLKVSEQGAPGNNVFDEEFTLNAGSNGVLQALEDARPAASLFLNTNSETINVTKVGPFGAPPLVQGIGHLGTIRSMGTTNDPAQVHFFIP